MNIEFLFLIITRLVERVAWPFLIFLFRSQSSEILRAIASMFSKVEQFKFKDLSVVLSNNNVPQESKILLTQQFISSISQENKKILLTLLDEVVYQLDDIIKRTGSSQNSYPIKKI